MSIASELNLLPGSTIAIVDAQWGDTGKGKFVDAFAEWADIIARGTGGANAGHTICVSGDSHVFHLVPSGILHDADGKINVIGRGVALDPHILCEELDLLTTLGFSFDGLKISRDAHLVLPQHLVLDRLKEAMLGKGRIGTTGRGIGPVYADRVNRIGLSVRDLLNPSVFREKLQRNLDEKAYFLKALDPEVARKVMEHPHLESGRFYHPETIFDVDAIVARYVEYAERIRDMVCDTDELLQRSAGSCNILLEGAQGVLLSVDHGIHPHVTSSDCSLAGLAEGVGLREDQIDRVFSIVKAFYMTRVGEGIFPTELGGTRSAEWCGQSGQSAEKEQDLHPDSTVNCSNPFLQGIAIRREGNEYGATTRRPRRTGWLDLPLLRYAMRYAGSELILTKVDVLNGCDEIHICNSYTYTGPDLDLGDRLLQSGDELTNAIPYSEVLENVCPQYQDFPGWRSDICTARTVGDLPPRLLDIVAFVEKETRSKVAVVSVGPNRDQIVVL